MNLRYIDFGVLDPTMERKGSWNHSIGHWANKVSPILISTRIESPTLSIVIREDRPLEDAVDLTKIKGAIPMVHRVPAGIHEAITASAGMIIMALRYQKGQILRAIQEGEYVTNAIHKAANTMLAGKNSACGTGVVRGDQRIMEYSIRPSAHYIVFFLQADHELSDAIRPKFRPLIAKGKTLATYRGNLVGLKDVFPDLDVSSFAQQFGEMLAIRLGLDFTVDSPTKGEKGRIDQILKYGDPGPLDEQDDLTRYSGEDFQ